MRNPFGKVYIEGIGLGIVVLGGVIALSFYSNKKLDRLKQERDSQGVFVIGTATSEDNNLKGTWVVEYSYAFKGKKYSNSIATDTWIKLNEGRRRYYARIAVAHPDNAELFLDRPVPDSVAGSPDGGWDVMPLPLP
jgi:hypothetical protein